MKSIVFLYMVVMASLVCLGDAQTAWEERINRFGKTDEEMGRWKYENFLDFGLPVWEIQNDMRIYLNMYKWRYTKIMPTNFKYEFLEKLIERILTKINPYIEKTGMNDANKERVKLGFVSKFFLSNMAWFNDVKRYFKEELRQNNDDQANYLLS